MTESEAKGWRATCERALAKQEKHKAKYVGVEHVCRIWEDLACQPFANRDIHRAGSWNLCAVGEVRRKFPNVVVTLGSVPADAQLDALGHAFYDWVKEGNPVNALEILTQIEARVHALVAETAIVAEKEKTNGC